MGKVNKQIKSEFNVYTELVAKMKTVVTSPINVKNVKNRHPSNLLGQSDIIHPSIKKNINFEVEVKINNSKNFKFKLFCSEIFEKPFFRFDSDGPAHWNDDPETPLKRKQITPPHFHKYQSDGIEVAYKTKALLSATQLVKLEDINVCVMHFCQEANMRYKKSDFPEINLSNGELGLTFTEDDPLQNVTFQ